MTTETKRRVEENGKRPARGVPARRFNGAPKEAGKKASLGKNGTAAPEFPEKAEKKSPKKFETMVGLQTAISVYHEEILSQNEQLMEAQLQLRQSHDRFNMLYDQAPVGYVTLDRNGVVEETNQTAMKLLGVSRESITGRPLLIFVHDDDRAIFLNFMLRCRSNAREPTQWAEIRLRRRDGGLTHVQLSSVGVSRALGRGMAYLTAITDVSGRVEKEEQWRKAEAQVAEALRQRALAQAANEAKDRFLAMLSHELRTPLTPALMRLSAIVENPTLTDEFREDLTLVRNEIKLEARLIDDLLDINRILHGKFAPHLEYVDIREVIDRSLQVCQMDIQNKGITIVPSYDQDPLPVHGDSVRLQQVFWNILRNAAKFTPAGGKITIKAESITGMVRISISDSGIGIEPEVLPHIFEPFEQGGAKVMRRFGGLGLGLAISKAIIDAHKGGIQAISDGPDRGTTFIVTLPFHFRNRVNVQRAAARATLKPQNITPLRILLVEDHDATRLAMIKLLTSFGHELHPAANASEALAAAANGSFDLVVSDLGLPDQTGYELMRQLHAAHGLKGIALSGFGMEQDQARSIEAGFSLHITKPVTVQALNCAIDSVMKLPASGGTTTPVEEPE